MKLIATFARLPALAVLGLACFVAVGLAHGAAGGDKGQYTLFNPTPKELMREMSTDRPDKTESPYTVDAGHFQVEMDLFGYTRDHDTAAGADSRTETFSVGPVNLKGGLFNNVDLQILP